MGFNYVGYPHASYAYSDQYQYVIMKEATDVWIKSNASSGVVIDTITKSIDHASIHADPPTL